jgi:prephenate dehydrogenase
MLTRYNDFLHDFLNCENVEVSAKMHDKTVAFTSHLQNLILASYYNDFSKIDNQMWREIFTQNQKNIEYFMKFFLEKVQEKIDNNLLIDAIILANKTIMIEENIDIKKELFNPSLRMVFELKNGAMNYQNFVKNMHNFFENLVGKK